MGSHRILCQAPLIFYTLFETAKLSGVDDPGAYVALAAKRAIADHGAVTLPSDLT
jgi:hypothetical protein